MLSQLAPRHCCLRSLPPAGAQAGSTHAAAGAAAAAGAQRLGQSRLQQVRRPVSGVGQLQCKDLRHTLQGHPCRVFGLHGSRENSSCLGKGVWLAGAVSTLWERVGWIAGLLGYHHRDIQLRTAHAQQLCMAALASASSSVYDA